MELSVPVNNICTNNVYFGEKRKNIIVDGDFVKILYSTDSFEMNGMYIFIEFETINQSKRYDIEEPTFGTNLTSAKMFTFSTIAESSANVEITGEWVKIVNKNAVATPKRNIIFNSHARENIALIERLCQIEKEIVDRYIASNCPSKFASYALKIQLLSGNIKYHSENSIIESPLSIQSSNMDFSQSQNLNNSFVCGGMNEFRNTSIEKPTKEKYTLKISGIWETATQVGITMKFILANSLYKG